MKKKSRQVEQYIYPASDPDSINEFLDKTAPLIGQIVHRFNTLEECLNYELCHWFSDRTDTIGLIVINNMNYSSKVDLLKRFNHVYEKDCDIKLPIANKLVVGLEECGRLRNAVVHAEWENTDFDGYTHVKIKFDKGRFTQEYLQFTEESLKQILELISSTLELFDEVDEEKQYR